MRCFLASLRSSPAGLSTLSSRDRNGGAMLLTAMRCAVRAGDNFAGDITKVGPGVLHRALPFALVARFLGDDRKVLLGRAQRRVLAIGAPAVIVSAHRSRSSRRRSPTIGPRGGSCQPCTGRRWAVVADAYFAVGGPLIARLARRTKTDAGFLNGDVAHRYNGAAIACDRLGGRGNSGLAFNAAQSSGATVSANPSSSEAKTS